ncbi:MAG: VgrG-related protein, partial [Chloroflexi bacterium]|nr:VgrG-related protein [Chloroflexota bacterium]
MPLPIATLVSQVYIKRNGDLSRDDVMSNLAEIVVDQHCHLPDMFTLHLYDADIAMIDKGPFNLTDEIEIGSFAGDGQPLPWIMAEVTAIEPTFPASGIAELVIRGYDISHRLYRDKKSRAFVNMKDSDAAQEIAAAYKLETDIETTTIIYEHIFQHNQSNLEFLQARAKRIGFVCYVENNTLYFRRPSMNDDTAVSLQWGENNLAVNPRITLREQVDEVIVRGWDIEKQVPIVGHARQGNLVPKNGEAKDGGEWATAFGNGRLIITDHPVYSQTEADQLAAARMNEVSGTFIEIEGSVFRRADVKAGKQIELKGLGERFSGSYLVTNATHHYTPQTGLNTTFTVKGLRTGQLTEAFSPSQLADTNRRMVTAVVTNNKDPRNWGRVKLKYPWLTDDVESDWARLVNAGGGVSAIPAVGEEVFVGFAHGDFNRPYVLGVMWNGKRAMPGSAKPKGDEDRSKINSWESGSGHRITFNDVQNETKTEIQTAGGHAILLDDTNKKIELKTSGGIMITLDDNGRSITIKSSGNIDINSSGNLSLKSTGNMTLQAGGNMKLTGTLIDLN